MAHRQIVLDTETTGFDPEKGDRIVEIGCVELINRKLTGNNFHVYINPERVVSDEVIEVHGITNEFLVGKPVFAQVAQAFFDYIRGAELVIHNAAFDMRFINWELNNLWSGFGPTEQHCTVLDTLLMARDLHPGQKNSLDALCRRYDIDNSDRVLHGALLDAEILADVYLAMTGGQVSLNLAQTDGAENAAGQTGIRRLSAQRPPLKVVTASDAELQAHRDRLAIVLKKGGSCLWPQ